MIKKMKTAETNGSSIIRLIFDLKYINAFYKSINLSDDMEIYLNPDSVMFLKYNIKTIGEMIIGIAPKEDEDNFEEQNYNDDDDQYYDDPEIESN